MDGVKDLAAIIGLHNQLRTARNVLVGATWVTRSRVELESRA